MTLPPRERDFYQRLRTRVRDWLSTEEGGGSRWAEFVLLAPDLFHLVCKLAADPEVPRSERAKLAFVVAYFISPLDLIPEALTGPVGYLDDIALAAYVLNAVVNKTDPAVVRRHWAGEEDILPLIQKILAAADRMLGGGLWQRLRGLARKAGRSGP